MDLLGRRRRSRTLLPSQFNQITRETAARRSFFLCYLLRCMSPVLADFVAEVI